MSSWSVGQYLVGSLFILGVGAVVTSLLLKAKPASHPPPANPNDDDDAALRSARTRQAATETSASQERARRRAAAMQAQLEESLQRLGYDGTSVSSPGHRSGGASRSSSANSGVSESRLIREQQEREYADALARDKAKQMADAQAADTEAEAELQEALRMSRLSALAASVPPEPPADSPGVCTLALRWSDGSRTDRRFAASERLGTVLAFVESQNRHSASERVALYASYPRRALTDAEATLQQLGLVPNALLNVDFFADED
jgi:hypothetical protein